MHHFNSESGEVNRCQATKGGCPFSPENHFPNLDSALAHAEKFFSEESKTVFNVYNPQKAKIDSRETSDSESFSNLKEIVPLKNPAKTIQKSEEISSEEILEKSHGESSTVFRTILPERIVNALSNPEVSRKTVDLWFSHSLDREQVNAAAANPNISKSLLKPTIKGQSIRGFDGALRNPILKDSEVISMLQSHEDLNSVGILRKLYLLEIAKERENRTGELNGYLRGEGNRLLSAVQGIGRKSGYDYETIAETKQKLVEFLSTDAF